jgi:hypothetical protein
MPLVVSAADERAKVWGRYWSLLAERSAPSGSFAGGYEGTAIGHWWRSQMQTLQQGTRWLDLATGNGALPRIWSREVSSDDARCDAVDVAQIAAPPWAEAMAAAQSRRLRWHGGVSAEFLPFDDGSFDVVMSQYGFEYAERAAALAEMARVLSTSGALRLVMHHAAGRPALLARAEIEHIDDLVSDGGLWTLTCRLIEPFARSATPEGRATLAADASMELLREAFNASQDRIRHVAHDSVCPDVLHETSDAVARVLQTAIGAGVPPASSLAQRWSQHLHDSRLRLSELLSHALDEPAASDLARCLQDEYDGVALDVIRDQSHLMGWCLRATRR